MDVDPDLVHMEMQDTSGGTVMFLLVHLVILLGLGHTSTAKSYLGQNLLTLMDLLQFMDLFAVAK